MIFFKFLKFLNLNYKSTFVENFHDKKIKLNLNLIQIFKKINKFYYNYTKNENYCDLINKAIDFDRSFKKWDLINQSITSCFSE